MTSHRSATSSLNDVLFRELRTKPSTCRFGPEPEAIHASLRGRGLLGTVTHHVVATDASASMAQRLGSASLFEKAQDWIRAEDDARDQRREMEHDADA